jgi:NAD(P)H-dependent FMN reductase
MAEEFMRLLAFAASLRDGSLNRRLLDVAVTLARGAGAEVDVVRFRELEMPPYDGDENDRIGLPRGARLLAERLNGVAAVMIAAPEYNYSISGTLKNTIDWVSRARPMPWRGKSIYLLSASPSPIGGIRGLWQTRIPLEGCGALVFPDMFSLPLAHQAFTDTGGLRDAEAFERLKRDVVGFVRLAESVAPICSGPAASPQQRQIAVALENESHIQPR